MAEATEGKKLVELRVIDLKTELERRGLDKTGNKAALLDRLSKAISDDGEKPEEYLIVPSGGASKLTPRKNSVTGVSSQEESSEGSDNRRDEINDNAANLDMKIKQEVEQPLPNKSGVESAKEEIKEESEETEETLVPPVKKEEAAEPMEEIKTEHDGETGEQESKEEVEKIVKIEPTPPPAPPNPPALETNGIDNEDSINLTIGEDEENLLAEETETHERCKDGGEKKTEDNKKGDCKGNARAEGPSSKEGATAGTNGLKNKQDIGGDGSKSCDSAAKGQKRDEKDKKTSPTSTANASSRNLWVSGLSSTTRATDLKQVFSKYGKVIGAKVVTNARTPGARCYGYVTMSTSEDAAKCIQHLHRTELHGRVISVEKAKGDSQQSHMRKRDSNSVKSDKKDEKDKPKEGIETAEKKDKEIKKDAEDKAAEPTVKKVEEKSEGAEEKRAETAEKKDETAKDSDAHSNKSTGKRADSDRGKRSSDKRVRSWEHNRSHTRSRSRERRRRDDVLTFAKIREERERQRLRERERRLREEERRRREDMERQREIEQRQREEAARLEREREKLRRERERIEQEKAELLRLERERQKLEREKLERERIELKRQQMRLEESRRPPPPPSIKRTSSDRRDPRDLYTEPDRKRIASEHTRRHSPERVSDRRTDILERVSERRLDPSPPSRYESNSRSTQDIGLKKDFKRSSEFPSRSSRPDVFPEVTRGREVIVRRETIPAQTSSIDPRQVKESRYERTASTTYGRDREVRRSETESHRSARDGHTRYTDSTKPPGSTAPRDTRYTESSRSAAGWHAGPPSAKSFNSVTSAGPREPRNDIPSWSSSRSSENVNRWGSTGSIGTTMRHPGPPLYQGGGPMPSMSLAPPGTGPSYDRFESYKPSIPSMRKY